MLKTTPAKISKIETKEPTFAKCLDNLLARQPLTSTDYEMTNTQLHNICMKLRVSASKLSQSPDNEMYRLRLHMVDKQLSCVRNLLYTSKLEAKTMRDAMAVWRIAAANDREAAVCSLFGRRVSRLMVVLQKIILMIDNEIEILRANK